MTDVHFSWKQLDGLTNPYKSTSGVVTITPLRYSTEDRTLITDAPISKRVTGSYTFKLPPNPAGTFFKFTLEPNAGSPVEEYRLIPDESLVEYVDLSKVDGEANYIDDPSVPAWVAELEQLKQSGDFFVKKIAADVETVANLSTAAAQHAVDAATSANSAASDAAKSASSATKSEQEATKAADASNAASLDATKAESFANKAKDEADKANDAAATLNADAKTFGDAVRSGTFKGDAGPANKLEIISTKTVSPDTPSSVTISGEAPNQYLSFEISRGKDGNPTPYELRGTGFPEGKVAAPVGTYYTDESVTNGAWRWFKKTGTGTNGWIVQEGDTGNRWIDGDTTICPQTGVTASIRRVGNQVRLTVWGIPRVYNTDIFIAPSGFGLRHILNVGGLAKGGPGSSYQGISWVGNAIMQPPLSVYDNVLRYPGIAQPDAKASHTASWITRDQWPGTLPGVPDLYS